MLYWKKFPATRGLYVTLSRTLSFPSQVKPYVQILNCNQTHWICVSTIGCKPNAITVYDSLFTGDAPTPTKELIATLMCSQVKTIYLHLSWCSATRWLQLWPLCSSIRSHFLHCLEHQDISSFSCCRPLYYPEKPKVTSSRSNVCVVYQIQVMTWFYVQNVESGSTALVLTLNQELR